MPARRSLLIGLGAGGAASLLGCDRPAPRPPPPPPDPLDELPRSYEALMGEHGLAEWSRYAGEAHGTGEAAQMADLRRREREVISRIADACRRDPSRVDPREAELWTRAERGLALLGDPKATELADKLEKTINDHVFEVEGKRASRSDLRKMSQADDPALRRSAHQAWVVLHREAAPVARELLRRRRDLARELRLDQGFYAALLDLRGIPLDRLGELFGGLDERTRKAYIDALVDAQKAANLPRVTLYDLNYLSRKLGDLPDDRFPAERALPFAREAWSALGVDLDNPRVRVDVRDFAFAGQTISITIPADVRAVVSPAPGSRFYATLMHELGHAFASTRSRADRAVFKGYEWVPGLSEPGYDEGVAEIFGRLLDEPEFLARFFPSLSADERARFLRTRARGELFGLRSRLVSVAFEREALSDPDQDLDALWRRLHRVLLGVDVPDDAGATWATSPFLATYPVYTQSYTLAAMISCQIRRALRLQLGDDWVSPRAGQMLAEKLVADGARSRTDDKMLRLTGAKLGVEAYAAWMSG